jgi:phosphoserine aminotransferase
MIDPITASSLAVKLAASCVMSAKLIKNTIESMRKVGEGLLELLNRTERMRNILELLRKLLRELLDTPHRDMAIGLNEAACTQTMTELKELATKIAKTKLSSSFLASAQWLHYESKARDLVRKLRDQEADIVNILVIIGV